MRQKPESVFAHALAHHVARASPLEAPAAQIKASRGCKGCKPALQGKRPGVVVEVGPLPKLVYAPNERIDHTRTQG